MFSISNITVSFSGEELFRNVSFLVNPKDKVGLVGKNGSGKTTLLRVFAGILEPATGEVVIPADKKVGYLPQEIELLNTRNVIDEALVAYREVLELEEKIRKLSENISLRDDYHSDEYLKLVNQLSELNDHYLIIGGNTLHADAEKVLLGLGFKRSDFDRKLKEFSHGWQMRVEIAKILLQKPDLLLLDEPTNHLDIESILWLEEFLITYQGAVILVSHDRSFLDNVTQRTIEIELGRIFDYKVPYSQYVKLREDRLETQISAYNNQQKQIRQIERFIERFRYKNTKSRQVQSRIKMLEKMEEIELDTLDTSAIHFYFPIAPPSGKVIASLRNLSKKYGTLEVLENLNYDIIKNDRIAFVGRNGEGKTTLSKILVGKLDYDGEVVLGHNVRIGYFAQNANEMLDGELTVFDTIEHVAVGDIRAKIRTILGGFLFSDEDVDKKVKVLSGGEKSRLLLAKLLLEPVNLLVLDEPTNHLDMRSKDILKNALIHYQGTMVIVSHDRDFLQGLTNKVLEFKDRKIREYLGDIQDFLYMRKMNTLKELESAQKQAVTDLDTSPSVNKQTYERKKEIDRELRKVTNLIQSCENTIENLEEQIKEMDKLLSDPAKEDVGTIKLDYQTLFLKYSSLQKELKMKMEEWEQLHTRQDALSSERQIFS